MFVRATPGNFVLFFCNHLKPLNVSVPRNLGEQPRTAALDRRGLPIMQLCLDTKAAFTVFVISNIHSFFVLEQTCLWEIIIDETKVLDIVKGRP